MKPPTTNAALEDLDKRVTVLEKAVRSLTKQAHCGKPGWRATIGLIAGDDVMKEIFKQGRQIRNSERPDDKK